MNEKIVKIKKKQIVAIVIWLAIGIFCILVSLARNYQPVFNAYEHYLGFPGDVFEAQDEGRDIHIKQEKQGDLSVFYIDYDGDFYIVRICPTSTSEFEGCYELVFSTGEDLLYKGNGVNLTPERLGNTGEDERIDQIGLTVVHLYLKEYQHVGTRYPAVRWGIHFFIGFLIFVVQIIRKNENEEVENDNPRLKKRIKVWRVIGIIVMVWGAMGLLMIVTDEVPRFASILIWASHNGVK